jgi:hypothetical protein
MVSVHKKQLNDMNMNIRLKNDIVDEIKKGKELQEGKDIRMVFKIYIINFF